MLPYQAVQRMRQKTVEADLMARHLLQSPITGILSSPKKA